MSKFKDFFSKEFFSKTYVWFILILFYIPIIFGSVFSFNELSKKGDFSFTWNKVSNEGWVELFSDKLINAFINSFLIGIITSTVVVIMSLLTVYALWRQKSKTVKTFVNSTSSIPLINPDIISAVGLSVVLSIIFGSLLSTEEGIWRAIVSHIVMTIPYGILLMYPKSEKISLALIEASKDLGYGPIRTWFKVYFNAMIPAIIFTFAITLFLSFDDFIITRFVSNTSTIGTELYQGKFKTWSLALGTIMLLIVIVANMLYIINQIIKNKKVKNVK